MPEAAGGSSRWAGTAAQGRAHVFPCLCAGHRRCARRGHITPRTRAPCRGGAVRVSHSHRHRWRGSVRTPITRRLAAGVMRGRRARPHPSGRCGDGHSARPLSSYLNPDSDSPFGCSSAPTTTATTDWASPRRTPSGPQHCTAPHSFALHRTAQHGHYHRCPQQRMGRQKVCGRVGLQPFQAHWCRQWRWIPSLFHNDQGVMGSLLTVQVFIQQLPRMDSPQCTPLHNSVLQK